jgi:hypothetical protein
MPNSWTFKDMGELMRDMAESDLYEQSMEIYNKKRDRTTSIRREYNWEEVWRLNHNFLTTA